MTLFEVIFPGTLQKTLDCLSGVFSCNFTFIHVIVSSLMPFFVIVCVPMYLFQAVSFHEGSNVWLAMMLLLSTVMEPWQTFTEGMTRRINSHWPSSPFVPSAKQRVLAERLRPGVLPELFLPVQPSCEGPPASDGRYFDASAESN